jgi:prepilin-type N-terminal cleavage/methylation domain-containing protein
MSDKSDTVCERRGFGPIGKRVLRSAVGRAAGGFTLIELLVAIAVVVLLMAILVPALQRVRRQAGAVVCQSNLRQWALIYSAYTHDYDGRFWRTYEPVTNRPNWWVGMLRPYCEDSNEIGRAHV